MDKKINQKIVLFIALFLLTGMAVMAQSQFTDNMDSFNTSIWGKSDGWTNGNPFYCTWRASCVTISGGYMNLTLDRESGGNPPYKSGEYRTVANYRYGLYEVRMKPAKASGIVSSFFTYTGPSDNNNPWDEIDIEILGKDTTKMQTNYFTNGTGNHETIINLGFDASAAFHTYGFEWLPNQINWYVDGVKVLTENGSRGALPTTASKIMMNLWPGTGVDSWLGPYNGTVPLTAQYDWVRFTPQGTVITPTPTATPTQTPTATPTRTPTQTPYKKGDVNHSGNIDINDALLIARYSASMSLTNFDAALADVNCSGGIDINDALIVARYSAGLITSIPCP